MTFGFDPDDATASVVSTRSPRFVSLDQCPTDMTRAKSCRVHWRQLLLSTAAFNALQNAGNAYTGYWYRWETTHGKWFDRWINSAEGWRWNVWNDQNPVLDDYVAHPFMGSITNYLWIQNDPKGMTVEQGNTPEYWNSRLRAFVFSTAYSFEWKLGPFGEAGVGHNGDHLVPQNNAKVWTNETGWVELVTTPVGGFAWTLAEDALDKHLVRRFEESPRGPLSLLLISFLTPTRATANIFRFRPPWYRDDRRVAANTFWSEPDEEDKALAAGAGAEGGEGVMAGRRRVAENLPEWPHPGGVHEFGAWWGFSGFSGPIWGYRKDVTYMPVDVTYSYLLTGESKWNLRYSPELTALAMLDEPNWAAKDRFTQRRRTYGSGVSPVGFRASFYPNSRVQPFFSTNGGFLYFDERVLSPQGSQFMYTIDFGGGIQIFRKQRQAISLGYRYQHLSNANISHHNPGTDANTFYVAVSRFRTKHYR
ncbi:acyloxyacyl hydrolase [Acidobacteria bacterium AB60]|nr:acyloxyacyl hydrolase [Acidobacteria bacterium AB60]